MVAGVGGADKDKGQVQINLPSAFLGRIVAAHGFPNRADREVA